MGFTGAPCHPEISGKLTTEVGRLPGAPPVAQDFQGQKLPGAKTHQLSVLTKRAQTAGCLEFIGDEILHMLPS